jgi:hypothetical protein
MTDRVFVLVAAAALLAPTATPAQTLDEIVSLHVAARGGREALAAVRTVRMTGRATSGSGRQAIVRREIARPGRIRTEFVFQGTTGVYAFDGSAGWRVSPLDGRFTPEPLPGEEAAVTAEQADIDGPLVDWKAKGHRLELVGSEALPGGRAHRLRLTLASGAVRELWLDAASALVVRSLARRALRGREVALETTFGDYRKTDGVAFARSIEAGVANRPQRVRVVVESVETNVSIDEARFRLPN